LDNIYTTSPWDFFHVSGDPYHFIMGLMSDYARNRTQSMGYRRFTYKQPPQFNYDRLNWFGYSLPRAGFWVRGAVSSVNPENLRAQAADVQELQANR
jgi:hypothetical protein